MKTTGKCIKLIWRLENKVGILLRRTFERAPHESHAHIRGLRKRGCRTTTTTPTATTWISGTAARGAGTSARARWRRRRRRGARILRGGWAPPRRLGGRWCREHGDAAPAAAHSPVTLGCRQHEFTSPQFAAPRHCHLHPKLSPNSKHNFFSSLSFDSQPWLLIVKMLLVVIVVGRICCLKNNLCCS